MKVDEKKIRLDKFLAKKNKGLSRSKIQKLIKTGFVSVNGEIPKIARLLKFGDIVEIKDYKEEPEKIESERMDIDILYEDDDFLVANKPAGIVVHPSSSGNFSGTVVNAFLNRIDKNVGEKLRSGIVHRLDKDTSGALIIAKTKKAYLYFSSLFKNRIIKKVYICLVKGILEHKEAIIDSPIGRNVKLRKRMALASERDGKNAITRYRVVKEYDGFSLLEVKIMTGRTHQIRVHMSSIGHPVIGDVTYGILSYNRRFKEKYGLARQFLHAKKVEFKDLQGKEVKILAPLPNDLKKVLSKL